MHITALALSLARHFGFTATNVPHDGIEPLKCRQKHRPLIVNLESRVRPVAMPLHRRRLNRNHPSARIARMPPELWTASVVYVASAASALWTFAKTGDEVALSVGEPLL